VANSWNTTLQQTAANVTATSLSYNGALTAGGSTTFGLQANGTSTTPTLTCTAS
ncbi:cellulose binding domain-containing protein, partial [Streptacidiphilus monticola]